MFISSFIKFQELRATFEEMLRLLELIFESLSSFIKVCTASIYKPQRCTFINENARLSLY